MRTGPALQSLRTTKASQSNATVQSMKPYWPICFGVDSRKRGIDLRILSVGVGFVFGVGFLNQLLHQIGSRQMPGRDIGVVGLYLRGHLLVHRQLALWVTTPARTGQVRAPVPNSDRYMGSLLRPIGLRANESLFGSASASKVSIVQVIEHGFDRRTRSMGLRSNR